MSYAKVEESKNYLLDRIGTPPDVAVILGSGMSAVDGILRDSVRVEYSSIPHFPTPTVAGHRGEVVFGKAGASKVAMFKGRVHYYEGAPTEDVTRATRVIGQLGAKALLLTNAAGAINLTFHQGDLMLITDHISLLVVNPLAGPNEERWGPRFLDQTAVYDMGLREQLQSAARSIGAKLVEGIYAAVPGPTYETPAEIRFLRSIGADAVGMSTVPEAIVARHMGVRVAGISLLTDEAAGVSDTPISHEEVLHTAERMSGNLAALLTRFFEDWPPA